MPEPVPVDAGQFERLARGLELPIEQIAPTERGTVPGLEHESARIRSGGLQSRKNLDTFRAKRDAAFAPLAFRFIEMAFVDRLCDR